MTTTFNHIIDYQQSTKHIVIVDDNTYHRQFMSQMLLPLGFKVTEFESAEHCLNNTEAVDLYLLDIFMPLISGWELAKQLRKQKIKTPIIMVSANADEIEDKDQLSLKHNIKFHLINDYIVKPVRYETLLDKIEQHLGLTWQYEKENTLSKTDLKLADKLITSSAQTKITNKITSKNILKHKPLLIEMAEVGYVKGLNKLLIEIALEEEEKEEVKVLQEMLKTFQFKKILNLLKESKS